MALIYPHTTLVPSKLDLLAEWLPAQPWFTGDPTRLVRVGGYRLDDPEGEVGLDGMLITAGDATVYHVPLTYRATALDESEGFFVGNMEHGVLGTRWAIAGAGDPVYRAVVAQVIAQGGTGALEVVSNDDGSVVARDIAVPLVGSGSPDAPVPEMWAADVVTEGGSSLARTGFAELRIVHVLDTAPIDVAPAASVAPIASAAPGTSVAPPVSADAGSSEPETLTATWEGQETPVVLATLRFVA